MIVGKGSVGVLWAGCRTWRVGGGNNLGLRKARPQTRCLIACEVRLQEAKGTRGRKEFVGYDDDNCDGNDGNSNNDSI